MTSTFVMPSIAGYITLERITNGTLNTKNCLNVKSMYPTQDQHADEKEQMKSKSSSLREYEYTQTDGQVRYLLAPNLEQAAWSAAELSGGSQFLKNVKQTYEW